MMSHSKYEQLRKIRDDLELFLNATLREDVSVVLPANLSKTFLLNNKPDEVDELRWLAGCYHIIHTILQLSFDKKYIKGKQGGYVPVSSELLKTICGNSYKRIFLNNLIDLNIIECDDTYSKAKHISFGYRLAKRFRGQPLKNRTIKDPAIKKAILKHRKERLIELKERVRPIAHVARWSLDKRLEINKVAAIEYLQAYRYRMRREIAKRNLKPKYQAEEEIFVNTRYYRSLYQVKTWGNSPGIAVDEAGGRLYTAVTGLMSPLRHFLIFNGESLVSFDLKNSQPLHFLPVLQPNFWKKGGTGYTLEKIDNVLYDDISNEEGTSPFIMFTKALQTSDSQHYKNPSFRLLVRYGKLYEFICNRFYRRFHNTTDAVRFSTRSKTKTEVLKLMYFNPRESYSTSHEPFEEFSRLFPVETAVMSLLKKRDYRDFAILLQKIEARILLHDVCREVYDISSDIPLFTVHDSIITTEQYAPVLEAVLLRRYTEILGFPPQLKKEALTPQQADLENMKYVKGKIDQAEIEVIREEPKTPGMFPFLRCEHWNIDKEIKEVMEPQLPHLGEIPGIPNINIPRRYNW